MSCNYDYWYFDSLFSKEQIINLNNYIEQNNDGFENKDNGAKYSDGSFKKNTIVNIIKYSKIKSLMEYQLNLIYETAQQQFGYVFFNNNENEHLLFNKYSSENLATYDFHTDLSKSDIYDIKLTFIANMSTEKYEGGKFYLFNNDVYEVKELNNPGSAIIFKSHINHKVSPVTMGERKSLAYFMKGPKFR